MSATIRTDFVPGSPRLAYQHAGNGETVVFMHGIGGNARNWLRQVEAFSGQFRAVAWDARGYGDSDDYEGTLDFGDFRTDLLRLLDHLEVTQAHLCGLSMGGRIALDFYDHFPARVASLTIVDSFPGFDASFSTEAREKFVRERRQPLVDGKEPADIAPGLARMLVSPQATEATVQELIDSISMLHKVSYIKTVEAMTMYQPVTDVSTIQVPVQLIVGADDKLTPPAISEQMAREIPNARLLIIERAGHLTNIEQPEAFNDCLRSFLRELQ
jgi:3-oxoadipate enol-lactonase